MIGDMINKTEVGYFATAGKFVDLIVFLPMVLVQTVTPMLIREKTNRKHTKLKEDIRKHHHMDGYHHVRNGLMLSYWLITYTYGMQYTPTIPVLQIMAFKAVGIALSSRRGQIIIMEHIQNGLSYEIS